MLVTVLKQVKKLKWFISNKLNGRQWLSTCNKECKNRF